MTISRRTNFKFCWSNKDISGHAQTTKPILRNNKKYLKVTLKESIQRQESLKCARNNKLHEAIDEQGR